MKKIFDLTLILCSLPFSLPVLLLLALLVRVNLGAPVLFTQTRPSQHGRHQRRRGAVLLGELQRDLSGEGFPRCRSRPA